MMRARRKIVTFLLGLVMSFAIIFGVVFAMPKTEPTTRVDAATTYNTKDIAMMGRIAGWHGNGNFEIRLTLGECDWSGESQKKYAPSEGMPGDLPGVLRAMDFFNHIKVGGKTLAEWGCTTCYDNIYWLNLSEPDYTLQIPLAMGKENMTAATAAGVGGGSLVTILEGALIPSDAYLQGNASATVYRAGCEFQTISAGVDYGIAAIAKTDVEALQYTTGWDANLNNAYLGVSLKGDDYAGNGEQTERAVDYGNAIYMTNHYSNTIKVNGEKKAEGYGLFNLGSKGAGYYSFVWRVQETEIDSITIPAGTMFPSQAMKTLKDANGHFVYIMYQTQTDVTFYKQSDGTWQKPMQEIESNLTMAKVVSDSKDPNDQFLVFSPENNDYGNTLNTYAGTAVKASEFVKGINFYSHIFVDDAPLAQSSEAFINVWRNYGTFGVRPGKLNATKITVLEGCQLPTYNALENGEREIYVTTKDVTFVKDSSGEWVKYVPAGDFDTEVTQVQFGRSKNVLNINLSDNDYPTPDGNNAETYNIAVAANKILELNLLDNIIVDGYTLRSKYAKYADSVDGQTWLWVNRFVGHNFAVRVPNKDGAQFTANKIVIRAGAQFPSMAYINDDAQAFYVTTEEVTYVRTSDNVETAWERLYTITFMADGKKVASLPYTVSGGIQGAIPEVPEKSACKGVWEHYALTGGNIVVDAVYSEHGYTEIETNVSKMQFEQGFVILYLTTNDYPTNEGTLDVKNLLGDLHFFDYLEVDGKRASATPAASDGAFLSVWGRYGSFSTYLPGHYEPTTSVVIKKGAQFPSNAQRLDNNNKTCYVLTEDVTFLFENGEWVRQSTGDGGAPSIKPAYEKDYILSDLYQPGYPASTTLNNGYLYVDSTTSGNVYGYNTSDSFSLTFDFTLNLGNQDVSALGNYTTFDISISTRGYSWSKAFGWNFYLYRPGNTQKCIEFIACGTSLGTWEEVGIFEKGQTYRVTLGYQVLDAVTGKIESYINVNGSEDKRIITLPEEAIALLRNVDAIAFSTSAAISNAVLITDPDFTVTDTRYNVTVQNGDKVLANEKAWKYTLPALSDYEDGKAGEVFLGWTTDINTVPDLYPAGCEFALKKDTTFYAVWMHMSMQSGAAVRKVGESGLRFLVDLDGASYEYGVSAELIVGAGTLVVPSSYLDGGLAFVHESFPEGYFLDIPTDTWTRETGSVWTYAAALINISPAQYTRAMSARGYIKLAYTDGTVAYVYTAYSKDLHSRSIYSVATAAVQDNVTLDAVRNYVNSVADITINGAFEVSKSANSVGNYTVQSEVVDSKFVITFEGNIKALMINGTRILAGYSAEILIAGNLYVVDGFKLNTNGLTLTFEIGAGDTNSYYADLVEFYENSEEYSALNKQLILDILAGWNDYSDAAVNMEKVAALESVKTKTEEGKNVGATKLATPVATRGDGYTVVWKPVENADYYIVTESNDYRDGVRVMADETLVYRPEVVGKHNVSVTAYSYYDTYAQSEMSAAVATVEVKPVYSYKAMSDGLYKFSEASMKALGIGDNLNTANNGTSYYYDSGEEVYFAYYNKETGWSKNQGAATDWTSPDEFPAHLARLKALGNNVILISEGSVAALGENAVWEDSRTKYVMDTAWTFGIKVIVCDDVIYQQSKEVSSKSKAKDVINGRMHLLENYINHPAFFGFSLEDEPEPYVPLIPPYSNNEIAKVGYMVQGLKEICSELGYSKANGNEPFFLSCLYQYAEGFEDYSYAVQYDDYLDDWFNGTSLDYVYVDLYTGHAMGDNTNRYEMTYDVVYGSGTNGVLGNSKKFYQVLTAHTQSKDKTGVLTDADVYMSILYAAAHNVAGYSWFCYFPINDGDTEGSMVGFNGNGYGNGINNGATNGRSYYSAAQSSAMLFEWLQGKLDGYTLSKRSYSSNLLTTTLSNGSKTIKMYVNADTMSVSNSVSVSGLSGECYILGYGVNTASACYQVYTGSSVTLLPGQAIICLG